MNPEFKGWTAIDTLYEMKGFQLCERFYDSMFNYVVPLLIIAGFARLLWVAADENRMRHVVWHVIYLMFILFAISPVYVPVSVPAEYALQAKDLEDLGYHQAAHRAGGPVVRAPRAVVWIHFAVDGLTRILVRQVSPTFEKRAFAGPRAEVLLRQAQIRDPKVRERYFSFVASCYLPVLAVQKRMTGAEKPKNWWDPFGIPDEVYAEIPAFNLDGDPVDADGNPVPEDPDKAAQCDAVLRNLRREIENHVLTNEVHAKTSSSVEELLAGKSGSEVVKRHVVYNETAALLATSEIKELEAAIPVYDLDDPHQDASAPSESELEAMQPDTIEKWTFGSPLVALVRVAVSDDYREKQMKRLKVLKNKAVKTVQAAQSNLDKNAEGPSIYYRVCTYGPFVYGLTMMVLIGFFPFAGFIALLPRHWMALVAWAKLLLWVKLWIVLWAVFNGFHQWQFDVVQGTDTSNGIGNGREAWSAVAAMYVMTPALAGLVVSLLSAAAQGVKGAVVGVMPSGGQGSGINAVTAVQHIAGALK